MTKDIQQRILELKKEKDVCILAHCYQTHDILEVADFVGDSFGLAQKAAKAPNSTVMMCGVRFMAETVKILSPEKRVLIPRAEAGCPMAEQLDVEMLTQLKQMYPDHKVVAYINTTAALKTLSDVCVTSSSAVKIIRRMDADKILFIPDCNLGDYVKKQIPEKEIQLVHGGCPTHAKLTAAEVHAAKELHPNALVLVHPECPSRDSGACGFRRKHHRDNVVRREQRSEGVHHRHREQHSAAPGNRPPGEAVLPSLQGLRMSQYEGDYNCRCPAHS